MNDKTQQQQKINLKLKLKPWNKSVSSLYNLTIEKKNK